jgi:hypothetical protein
VFVVVAAVATVIGRHVKRLVIANPMPVRVIAPAKIKIDTIHAGVQTQLYASGFLPAVVRLKRRFYRKRCLGPTLPLWA